MICRSVAHRAAAQCHRKDGAGLKWMVHDIVERFGRHALGTEGWRAEWVVIRELRAPDTETALALMRHCPPMCAFTLTSRRRANRGSVKSNGVNLIGIGPWQARFRRSDSLGKLEATSDRVQLAFRERAHFVDACVSRATSGGDAEHLFGRMLCRGVSEN
jgi:hypothetical protein